MKKTVIEKYKDKSFAGVSEIISKKYKNRDLNRMANNSFLAEIGLLMQHQDKVRLSQDITKSLKDYRKPTNVSKYEGGGMVTDDIYAPVTLGKGLEFAGKLAMLASGYDKVNPEYNPYESDIRARMASRSVDMSQVKQNIASTVNQNFQQTGNVRSEAVRQALNQNTTNTAANALAQTSLQQQDMNNRYSAEYAGVLDTLGQQRVGANRYAEQLNQQAKGNYQLGLQGALETVGNVGQKLTDYRANVAQQEILTSVLTTNNFEMNSARDILSKAESGQKLSIDDFIRVAESNGKTAQEGLQLFLEYKKKTLG